MVVYLRVGDGLAAIREDANLLQTTNTTCTILRVTISTVAKAFVDESLLHKFCSRF